MSPNYQQETPETLPRGGVNLLVQGVAVVDVVVVVVVV